MLENFLDSVLAQAASRSLLPMTPHDPLSAAARPSTAEPAPLERVLAWGRGDDLPTPHTTLGLLFESAVRRNADADALVWRERVVSYRALNADVNRLAHRLRALGVGPEARVAVCMSRGPGMVTALLAILKAGGAYVPIDLGHPPQRRAFILRDSGAVLCLTEHAEIAHVPAGDWSTIALDEEPPPSREWHDDDPKPLARPGDLAYVIYTSGSTGTPKGVCVEHRSAVDFVVHNASAYRVDAHTRMLALASIGFDVSVAEIFSTLIMGAALIIADAEDRTSPDRLQRLLHAQRVTVAQFPPALLALMDADGFPDLQLVLVGGEAAPAGEVRRWVRAGHRVVNGYGPTETTVTATQMECDARPGPSVPIGRPMPNRRVYVLDERLELVAPCEPGELFIAGIGVARGYLGRPELTAERFLPDPFAERPGERMYRTGDRVRWNDDGALEFLGRVDDQLNIRGYRIEPGEVEARLMSHPDVGAAAVVGRPGAHGQPCLAAFVVARRGAVPPSGSELEAWCAQSLPAYMVPSTVAQLDALPLTPNGKTDRAALVEAPAAPRAVARRPSTTTEAAIAAIWQDLLSLEEIGVTEDLLTLGGHSLLAMRLLSRLRRHFDVELDAAELATARTIAAQAALIDARLAAKPAGARASTRVPRASAAAELPISQSQQRLWLVDRLGLVGGAFNVPIALRLYGRLELSALERALADVVVLHDELRACFPVADGQATRRLAAAGPVTLVVSDLRTLADREERERACSEIVRRETVAPFGLHDGPLWRGRLLRLSAEDHVLVLVLHHIVCDGWSLGVLLADLGERYAAHLGGQPCPYPAPAMCYGDYAIWQRDALQGDVLRRHLDFWRETLANAPAALELPTDRERPPVQSYSAGRRRLELAPELTARLRTLGRGEGVTLFVTLLAAYQVLLGRLSGSEDVVVACPVAGRPEPELESVIGFFVNTVAMRTDLSGAPRFDELLRRVGGGVTAALAHDAIPFDLVVEALRPVRDLSRNPLAQVALNLHSYPAERLALPGIRTEDYAVDPPGSLFDLTLNVRERGEGLDLEAVYNSDLFEAARIDEMLAQYVHLLAQVTEDPDTTLDRFSLRSPRSARVLPDPSAPLATTTGPPVVERLARNASRTPDAVAVGGEQSSLTYAELEHRSDLLAARLQRRGIGAGDLVAIHAARTRELAVGLVGVLKSGASFSLLDGSQPPARLLEMLRSAPPRAWLDCGEAPPAEVAAELATLAPAWQTTLADATRPAAPEERDGAASKPRPGGPDDSGYVLFTSGSTGSPKAVFATQGPLTHFVDWYLAAFDIGTADRFAVLSGLAHDPLLRDILVPLCAGASTHVPPAEVHAAPERLLRWLHDRQISVLHATPQLGRVLVQAAADSAGRGATVTLSALRLVAFGGDVLREDDVAHWRSLAPEATLTSFYGTTETPQAMACELVTDAGSPTSARAVPLGRGIADVQLLVTSGGQPAGVGEVGEVCVRTPHLAIGYLHDDALTSQRFLTGPAPGERTFRTGDLGRYLPDGRVAFLGRRDGQVKIRGFRVEPAEIAAVLQQHPGVTQALVVPIAGPGGEPRLVAYVTVRPGEAGREDLQRHLRNTLPDHMVPAVVELERLPLTPNGKVDIAALPVPQGRSALSASYRPPSTTVERTVAGVWRDVLGVGAVGRDDNFFDLGGNSLRLVQVQSRLQLALDRELSIVELFRYPTIRALSAHFDADSDGADEPDPSIHRIASRRELRARRARRPARESLVPKGIT
jgi:amino acid adenylation domain-containing protein